MNIPDVPTIELSPEILKDNKNKTLAWGDYYSRQRVIQFFLPEDIEKDPKLFELKSDLKGQGGDKVVFIVSAPVSFFHMNDFKAGVKNAISYYVFYDRDLVKIITTRETLHDHTGYAGAFSKISIAVTGVHITDIVPDPQATDLMSAEEEQVLEYKVSKFKEFVDRWIEKFRKLPAVSSAELYDMDNPDRLVSINIRTSYPGDENIAFLCLNIGNTMEWPGFDDEGTSSDLFDKWVDALKAKTWEDVYKALVDLSNQYLSVPVLEAETE